MRIGQLPADHLGGSTLGVCGRQTCPVTCPMVSEMFSVSVGSRKPLGFPLPVLPFIPPTLDRDLQQISQADTAEQLARTRSMTMLVTSSASFAGSTCTLNGRFPNGVSTIFTIALATAEASASGGTMEAKPFITSSAKPL